MPYRDFQHFLQVLEEKGELRRIKEPVSPYLEITEIADRVMKGGKVEGRGPKGEGTKGLRDPGRREDSRIPQKNVALIFENVVGTHPRLGTPNPKSAVMGEASIHKVEGRRSKDEGAEGLRDKGTEGQGEDSSNPKSTFDLRPSSFKIPVAINTMGTRKRMSLALGVEDFEEHAERIECLLKPEIPKGKVEALKMLPKLFSELKGIPPKSVSSGICQEVVLKGDEIDLTKLPILTCWPEDGGPFITLPMVFTFDPETGKRNVGLYRMQLFDKTTCAMHWQMHKSGMRHMEAAGERGRNIEVAVALGGDPAYTFSALAPLPPGIDEMLFAGFLRRKGAELVKCKTVDISVPADAEIVLEGYVDPNERRLEGPFGDHTGYYSLAEDFPVFHCTCMTMRQKPVYPATIVGVPPMEDGWMGKAVERIFLPLIRTSVPEIVDINLPVEACFHNVAFVSIRKKYPGHAFKAMNAVWGLGGLAFTKFVFVFDEDCDVQDFGEVLFRIGANCDPARDTLHSRGPIDQLDHAALAEGFGGKLGFDCTHKWPGENGFSREWPKRIVMAEDVKKKVDEMWGRLGL
jgi:4-hydroxy-3-polyprenylbenzoate decarboxylase